MRRRKDARSTSAARHSRCPRSAAACTGRRRGAAPRSAPRALRIRATASGAGNVLRSATSSAYPGGRYPEYPFTRGCQSVVAKSMRGDSTVAHSNGWVSGGTIGSSTTGSWARSSSARYTSSVASVVDTRAVNTGAASSTRITAHASTATAGRMTPRNRRVEDREPVARQHREREPGHHRESGGDPDAPEAR